MKPFFSLSIGLLALLAIIVPIQPIRSVPSKRVFTVEASQYAYSPGVISVNPGDMVTINLVATDVAHGMYIEGYELAVFSDPGQSASITFVADKNGHFRLRCNVSCGAMHPFMVGEIQVGQNDILVRAFGIATIAAIAFIVYQHKIRPQNASE